MKATRTSAALAALGLLAAALHAQTPAPRLAVTLKPAAPVTGDNTLDVLATDASGAPVTGLKLTSTVFMTNMNMGTAHPPVKEAGKGHYKVTVGFLMDGPWRVTLKGSGVNQSFDFQAGSKQPWKMPAEKAGPAAQPKTPPVKPTEPATPEKPEEKKPDESKPTAKPEEKPTAPDKTTDMTKMPGMGNTGPQTGPGATGMTGMDHAMKMPQLKATGTKTVSGEEDWSTATGFGRNEPMVGMMVQMMVGGSGMESMKMAAMKMEFGDANFMPGEGGDMPGMDMKGKDMKDMPRMDMGNSAGVKATAKLAGDPKTGDNKLEITVLDAAGKPVEKAKIILSVAMTSMDMGTTHPAVKDLGKGKYSASVGFSMMGPWRVSAKVESGGKTSTFTFDYTAK